MDRDGLSIVRPLQMQTQGSYRGIKCLNDRQRLNLNRRFELAEELPDAGESRARHMTPER